MKSLTCVFCIFIQLLEACAELTFRHLTENQSLELSCSFQQDLSSLTGMKVYHRSGQSQTTLLSMAEGGGLRVNPEHRGRLQLRGGLDSQQVNVTISHLQHSDTGLYTLELSYRKEENSHLLRTTQSIFLLVEGSGWSCDCSHRYLPLLLTIFTATALLLFTLSWFCIEKCVRSRHRPQNLVPIYEEMTRKQQSASTPQNNQEAPSHLEEVNFPVYANPGLRPPPENYYACPRQHSVRA
ncbi:hypothetical protein Q5P01_017446 [Channa striata]|uniref:Immunoglobulin V-set domain-containing protein n=1 Tax=Channa striata TaxID=64152 RepID=A0AA88SHB6_CHASR|nr:hypothetical protein Q5P01_017446 [Channa striata]